MDRVFGMFAAVVATAGWLVGCAASERGVRVSERFGFDPEDSTRFLQAALDSGFPRIIVDRKSGPWVTLPLKGSSNQEIVLEPGVEIRAKRGEFRNPCDCLMTFSCCTNVTIVGRGCLRMWREDYGRPPYRHAEWRHAISLNSSVNVTIDGPTITESGGDGIYVSTAEASGGAPCRNIVIRNADCSRNYRQGISVISVDGLLVEDCRLDDTAGTDPQAGIDFEPNNSREVLRNCVVRRCTMNGNAGYGIDLMLPLMGKPSGDLSIIIEDCESKGNRRPPYRIQPASGGVFRSPVGQILFRNVRTRGTDGVEAVENRSWWLGPDRSKRYPEIVERFDLSKARVVDAMPGKVVRLANHRVKGRDVKVTFHADRAGEVELYFRQEAAWKKPPCTDAKMVLLDAENRELAKVAYPGVDEMRVPVSVPKAGFYSLLAHTGNSSLVMTRSAVPVALNYLPPVGQVRERNPWTFKMTKGEVYFVVKPGEDMAFSVCGGDGMEAVHVVLRDPDGTKVFERDDFYWQDAWKGVGLPKAGLWRVEFMRPTQGSADDFGLDVAGVPAFFFLSKDKYWK